jgi:hypothetical protein
MNVFERYLTVWRPCASLPASSSVRSFAAAIQAIGALELARESTCPWVSDHWVMIIPMLLRIDFAALGQVKDHARGIGVTLAINWLVEAVLHGVCSLDLHQATVRALAAGEPARRLCRQPDPARRGAIAAMVFVWSRLYQRRPLTALTQVALNDTIMIFAFAPIVALLLGVASITVPWDHAAHLSGAMRHRRARRHGAGRAARDPAPAAVRRRWTSCCIGFRRGRSWHAAARAAVAFQGEQILGTAAGHRYWRCRS